MDTTRVGRCCLLLSYVIRKPCMRQLHEFPSSYSSVPISQLMMMNVVTDDQVISGYSKSKYHQSIVSKKEFLYSVLLYFLLLGFLGLLRLSKTPASILYVRLLRAFANTTPGGEAAR